MSAGSWAFGLVEPSPRLSNETYDDRLDVVRFVGGGARFSSRNLPAHGPLERTAGPRSSVRARRRTTCQTRRQP
jgi:hypothetical protein